MPAITPFIAPTGGCGHDARSRSQHQEQHDVSQEGFKFDGHFGFVAFEGWSMRGESSGTVRAASRENIGTIVPRISPRAKLSKFGKVVVALWPRKPALNLAQRAGLSERGAQYIIEGKRKPNARAIHAINAELIG
jgi:hypothetical protein